MCLSLRLYFLIIISPFLILYPLLLYHFTLINHFSQPHSFLWSFFLLHTFNKVASPDILFSLDTTQHASFSPLDSASPLNISFTLDISQPETFSFSHPPPTRKSNRPKTIPSYLCDNHCSLVSQIPSSQSNSMVKDSVSGPSILSQITWTMGCCPLPTSVMH